MPKPFVLISALMNMRRSTDCCGFLLVLFCCLLFSRTGRGQRTQNQQPLTAINILFYNVENYFDFQNDSGPGDDDYLPDAPRHWTAGKFYRKTDHLAKVILACGGFSPPAIIGLSEVENQHVLEFLTTRSPLAALNYRIIHKESPDHRGIDVAVLYRPAIVHPLRFNFIPLRNAAGDILPTREILHVVFFLPPDTIDVFVNHWPSRYGGYSPSEPERCLAAATLRKQVLQVLQQRKTAKIILTGDFNDQPASKSIRKVLGAVPVEQMSALSPLVNLADFGTRGTIKYRQQWQTFDQFIVSRHLLPAGAGKGWMTSDSCCRIVRLPFLVEPDPKYSGKRLFRTYRGYHYEGGFSDHLPVMLHLNLRSF